MLNKLLSGLTILSAVVLLASCNYQTTSEVSHKTVAITSKNAPATNLPLSQAMRNGNLVFLSGQLGFAPGTMTLEASFEAEASRVFTNLQAVAKEAGGDLSDMVKLNIYLTDLNNFETVNKVMQQHFTAPYPARTTIQVAALPKNGNIEVEGIMVLTD